MSEEEYEQGKSYSGTLCRILRLIFLFSCIVKAQMEAAFVAEMDQAVVDVRNVAQFAKDAEQ